MKKIILFIVFVSGIAGACTSQPQPIAYGKKGCHYCAMTIVDKQYASQLVTQKGKSFDFDAVECMINFMEKKKKGDFAHVLVTDFNHPALLIPASDATFIRSATLPSPMGMYITAVDSKEAAAVLSREHKGEVYTWEALKSQFNTLPVIGNKAH